MLVPRRTHRWAPLLLAASLGAGWAPPAAAATLPFIENDWPRALAEARRRDVPVFVDAWAPW